MAERERPQYQPPPQLQLLPTSLLRGKWLVIKALEASQEHQLKAEAARASQLAPALPQLQHQQSQHQQPQHDHNTNSNTTIKTKQQPRRSTRYEPEALLASRGIDRIKRGEANCKGPRERATRLARARVFHLFSPVRGRDRQDDALPWFAFLALLRHEQRVVVKAPFLKEGRLRVTKQQMLGIAPPAVERSLPGPCFFAVHAG